MIPSRRRIAAALCLFVGTGIAVSIKLWGRFGSGDPKSLARIGRPLPHLLVEASDVPVDLKEITLGRRSVIVFYSPSCRTCAAELPALRPFPTSLRLVMVSESSSRKYEGMGFPEALLCYDRWSVLTRSFAAVALPTIVFVDEGGILLDGLVGRHEPGLLQRRLKEFADRPYQRPLPGP